MLRNQKASNASTFTRWYEERSRTKCISNVFEHHKSSTENSAYTCLLIHTYQFLFK